MYISMGTSYGDLKKVGGILVSIKVECNSAELSVYKNICSLSLVWHTK